MTCRENRKEPTLERGKSRTDFVNDWIVEHELLLNDALGVEDSPEMKFLTGILFATSTSKLQAPFLEDVIQADAANMSFGKYTLFSAYAGSANGKMVGLGFAILFGNEDKTNWQTFWEFLTKTHGIINQRSKVIITDQDKGSIASIKEVVPKANLLHCSFHRRQNILKSFGGGLGHTPLSPMWLYNLLMKSNTLSSINFLRSKYESDMSESHVRYLRGIPDEQQYPAARCESSNVCMYGKSALSRVEAMNRANDSIRRRTAVDVVNAIIVLLKKESKRFERSK
jgi:hypothetical protein